MVFIVCGLNHKTAPLSVREHVTRNEATSTHISACLQDFNIKEIIYLSTCNRTEIYCEAPDITSAIHFFAAIHQHDIKTIKPYLYARQEHECLAHAIRVASGLDSMMIGEPQIFGQLKQSYQEAKTHDYIGPTLRRYFQWIFAAAKKIRHQSGINENPISVASVAAQFIKTHQSNVKTLKVLIIGSGETANLVAKYLHQMGVTEFFVASRTQENAIKLAQVFNAQVVNITDIPQFLIHCDVIITATACPVPFITQTMALDALNARKHRPIMMLDLAVPRDIEPNVGLIDGIQLINVDDLHIQIEQGLEARKKAAQHAETLLQEEINCFLRKDKTLLANEAICDYRNLMQDIANTELQRAQQKLSNGELAEVVMHELTQRLVKKLTHFPTVGLKQAAIEGREELLDLAEFLFHKDEQPTSYE